MTLQPYFIERFHAMSFQRTAIHTPVGLNSPPLKISIRHSFFDALPDNAYARQSDLIKSAKNPTGPLPFSSATLWRMVKKKSFPAPSRLSTRVTAWNVGSVRAWMREVQA